MEVKLVRVDTLEEDRLFLTLGRQGFIDEIYYVDGEDWICDLVPRNETEFVRYLCEMKEWIKKHD